jgi:hypothetical protein
MSFAHFQVGRLPALCEARRRRAERLVSVLSRATMEEQYGEFKFYCLAARRSVAELGFASARF